MGKVLRRTTTVTEEILDEHEAERLDDLESEDDTDEREGEEDVEHQDEHATCLRFGPLLGICRFPFFPLPAL